MLPLVVPNIRPIGKDGEISQEVTAPPEIVGATVPSWCGRSARAINIAWHHDIHVRRETGVLYERLEAAFAESREQL